MIRETLIEFSGAENLLFCDGFDHCIVGLANRSGFSQPVVAYSYEAIIASLMKDGCTRDEAVEHFEFNIIGAWVGDLTPVFIGWPEQEIRMPNKHDKLKDLMKDQTLRHPPLRSDGREVRHPNGERIALFSREEDAERYAEFHNLCLDLEK